MLCSDLVTPELTSHANLVQTVSGMAQPYVFQGFWPPSPKLRCSQVFGAGVDPKLLCLCPTMLVLMFPKLLYGPKLHFPQILCTFQGLWSAWSCIFQLLGPRGPRLLFLNEFWSVGNQYYCFFRDVSAWNQKPKLQTFHGFWSARTKETVFLQDLQLQEKAHACVVFFIDSGLRKWTGIDLRNVILYFKIWFEYH